MAAEPLQDLRRRALGDQPVQDAAPVRTEDVRQRAAQPQAVVVQRLVHPLAGTAALRHQLAAVAAQLAQLAELARRHVARLAQAELADARQPQAVRHVALLAFHLLHEARMVQQRLDPRILQRLEGCLPENPGGFHARRAHAVREQPVGEGTQPARQRAELPRRGQRVPARLRQPQRGGDLHLVHVEAGRARVDHMHAVGAQRGLGGLVGLGHEVSSLRRRRAEPARVGLSRPARGGSRFTVRPGRQARHGSGREWARRRQFRNRRLGQAPPPVDVSTLRSPPPSGILAMPPTCVSWLRGGWRRGHGCLGGSGAT